MKTKITLLILGSILSSSPAMSQPNKKRSSRPTRPTDLSGMMKTLSAQNSSLGIEQKQKPEGPVVLTSKLDSGSYAFGMSIGEDLKFRGLSSLNYGLFARALSDVFEGSSTALTREQGQQAINTLFASVGQSKNIMRIVEGLQFAEANKKKTGVITLESGLQYEIISQGNGEKPRPGDQVTVHYKGTLVDGTQFDSSYDRKEPLVTALSQVIQGWQEGLLLMPVGSKYRFFIPYQLAYGERGSGSGIPPYSTLIFEIELLKARE